jgi:hypothetical protein
MDIYDGADWTETDIKAEKPATRSRKLLSFFVAPIASKRSSARRASWGLTDQQLLVFAVRAAGRIIAEYLEPGALGAEETLSRLIAVLDNEDLARAVEQLEKGQGLRVVK